MPPELSLDEQLAADEASRNQPDLDEHVENNMPEQPHKAPEEEQIQPEQTPQPDHDEQPEHSASDDDIEELRKRNARIHAEKRAAERERRNLEAQLKQMQSGQPAEESDDQRIQRLAAQQVAQQRLNDMALSIAEAGRKEFADFDEACKVMGEIGATHQMVEACAEASTNPARVWHYLGNNPDEAERIARMSPHQAGVAIAKVAHKLEQVKSVSKAPPPVKPLQARNKTIVAPEEEDIDVWMRKEDERWSQRRHQF